MRTDNRGGIDDHGVEPALDSGADLPFAGGFRSIVGWSTGVAVGGAVLVGHAVRAAGSQRVHGTGVHQPPHAVSEAGVHHIFGTQRVRSGDVRAFTREDRDLCGEVVDHVDTLKGAVQGGSVEDVARALFDAESVERSRLGVHEDTHLSPAREKLAYDVVA